MALFGQPSGISASPPVKGGFFFHNTIIDQDTIQSYLETEYRVYAQPAFKLNVGQASLELLTAHKRENVICSAFLTAWNPFSKSFDETANAIRQNNLVRELTSRGLAFLPGIGQHPSNGWPGEESFLVFGLSLDAARVLGTKLEQNGFIWSGADYVPQLILLQ